MTRTVAIIGLGQRIAHVWNYLIAAAGDRLLGYADPSLMGLDLLRTDPGQAFADHRAMLAALPPDVVMIGSPNHLHLDHIGDALAAGACVFSEKPVVISPLQTMACARLIGQYGADPPRTVLSVKICMVGRPGTSEEMTWICP